jgi:glycosyltransferase involved in cell wall biosynthesis
METEEKSTNKIKVLRIIARLNIGGPSIHSILLTAGLDKTSFDSFLVTGTAEKTEGDMFYLVNEKDVRPIIIPKLSRTLNIYNDFIAFWKLFRLMRKERPDIVHTHTAKAGTLGRSAGLLYKLTKSLNLIRSRGLHRRTTREIEGSSPVKDLKLIHTFHGHVLHSYFNRIRSAFFIRIERLLGIFTHKIIAVSESLRKELIDLRIAPPEKIVAIPLGLELKKFLKIDKNSSGYRDYKSVGIIGRLVPVKNHRMFLDAAKRLRDILGFKQRIKFLIVGDGPLRQELEDYTERLGIQQDVTFTGWRRDLEKIYSELDIIVLTSLNEGTPVALIEAMAAGKPVISTEVGGVKDLFSNRFDTKKNEGKSTIKYFDQGILIDSGDVESLATAIKELLKNDRLREKMGKRGRKAVYPKYDISRLIEDMKIFYMNSAGERK